MTLVDPFDENAIIDALKVRQLAEDFLEARAKAAGLSCSIMLEGWPDTTANVQGWAWRIRLDAAQRWFKIGKSRPTKYTWARSLADFDQVVAAAVNYGRSKR